MSNTSISIDRSKELGDIQFADSQYNTSNRLFLPSGVDVVLPNNKNGVLNLTAPADAVNWMDNTGKITPNNGSGEGYGLRITFVVDPTLNNRNFTLKLDIGGSQGVVWEKTERLARGAGVDTKMSFYIPYYALGTFFANGGVFKVNVDGDSDLFDIIHLFRKLIVK